MPSYLHGGAGSVCWNCDRATDEAAAVTVRTPAGGEVTFALCPACYAGVYAPLAARLADHAEAAPTAAAFLAKPFSVRRLVATVDELVADRAAPSGATPLRELRAERLLSIRDLARLADVAPSTVYLTEAGRTTPQPAVMRRIAAALGIDPLQVAEFRSAVAARARSS